MKVVRVDDKVFIGKNILHTDVWKKADERTTYNMIYLDAKTGRAMAKRFNVTSITRDKDYDLTTAQKGNKVLYFAAHKNGEAETIQIQLTQACKAKKKIFEFDFAEIDIKGRGSKGNIVTKYPVRKITQLELGQSSLGAIKIWIDEVSGRINKEERGKYLGAFDTGDQIIALYKNGNYEVTELDFNKKFEASSLIDIGKLSDDTVVSCIYWEGSKGWTMVKRFMIETKSLNTPITFISDSDGSKLYYASLSEEPKLKYSYKANNKKVEHVMDVNDFIDVKGYKALGNKLGEFKVLKIEELETQKKTSSDNENGKSDEKEQGDLSPGDTIEFDF